MAPTLLASVAGAAGCGQVNSAAPEADAAVDAGSADATVDAPVDAMAIGAFPVNTASAGTVAESGTLSLKNALVSTDADNGTAALTYTIKSLPADGVLHLDATTLGVGGTFTQQDVNDGKVSYKHSGAERAADSFNWELTDGNNVMSSTPFAITIAPVNDPPVIANNLASSVAEGGTLVLDSAKLMATDVDSATLTYTLVAVPSRGKLEKRPGAAGAFTQLAAGGTFTQQDIVDGNVRFVDAGTDDSKLAQQQDTSAQFSWRVADGAGGFHPSSTGSNTSTFTVTPVDDAPVISWRANICYRPNTAIDANPISTLTDVDTPLSAYSICVVSIRDGSTPSQTIGEDPVTPTLTNGASPLGVGGCVGASATSGLRLTSSAANYGGAVTWKLTKAGVQIDQPGTMDFPLCP